MKIRLINLLLIAGVLSLVFLNSCNKYKTGKKTNNKTYSEIGYFTDNRDSTLYEWVKLGDQIWMAENLAYTGDEIRYIYYNNEWKNNTKYDGWCSYNNDVNNGKEYGVLYQWEAAKKACPSGWHLPTEDEWKELIDYLGGEKYAGKNLKECGFEHWLEPNDEADCISGFFALPGGGRDCNGDFNGKRAFCRFWSATEFNSYKANFFSISNNSAHIYEYSNEKLYGYSVRCVKD